MKHTEDTKRKALKSIEKNGVKKTQEQMGISPQTLYKWRNVQKELQEMAPAPPMAENKIEVVKEIIQSDNEHLLNRMVQVEAENTKLRATNEKLKRHYCHLSSSSKS